MCRDVLPADSHRVSDSRADALPYGGELLWSFGPLVTAIIFTLILNFILFLSHLSPPESHILDTRTDRNSNGDPNRIPNGCAHRDTDAGEWWHGFNNSVAPELRLTLLSSLCLTVAHSHHGPAYRNTHGDAYLPTNDGELMSRTRSHSESNECRHYDLIIFLITVTNPGCGELVLLGSRGRQGQYPANESASTGRDRGRDCRCVCRIQAHLPHSRGRHCHRGGLRGV